MLRALQPAHDAIATIQLGGRTTSIVLLRDSLADKAWTAELSGATRLLISDDAELLLGDGDVLHVRAKTELKQLSVLICPSIDSLSTAGGEKVPKALDGVFGSFSFAQQPPTLPSSLKTTLVRPAGPPRHIPLAPSQKPQEPSAEDWRAAAEYKVDLASLAAGIDGSTELRLAIDYVADAARVLLGDRLLTDNWLALRRWAICLQPRSDLSSKLVLFFAVQTKLLEPLVDYLKDAHARCQAPLCHRPFCLRLAAKVF